MDAHRERRVWMVVIGEDAPLFAFHAIFARMPSKHAAFLSVMQDQLIDFHGSAVHEFAEQAGLQDRVGGFGVDVRVVRTEPRNGDGADEIRADSR